MGGKAITIVPYVCILPAYITEGYIAWEIYQGSYTLEKTLKFFQNDVLPLYNPFSGKNSVLIIDNAKIHHNIVEI